MHGIDFHIGVNMVLMYQAHTLAKPHIGTSKVVDTVVCMAIVLALLTCGFISQKKVLIFGKHP